MEKKVEMNEKCYLQSLKTFLLDDRYHLDAHINSSNCVFRDSRLCKSLKCFFDAIPCKCSQAPVDFLLLDDSSIFLLRV